MLPREQTFGGWWVVDTYEKAVELQKFLATLPGPFGVDTEANVDIDRSPAGQGSAYCWSLAWAPRDALTHPRGMPVCSRAFIWAEYLPVFKAWLEDPAVPKVGHNVFTFDRHIVLNAGIDMQGIVGDTLRMSRFLNADSSVDHSLKSLMARVMGYQPVGEYKDLFSRHKAGPISVGEIKHTRRKILGEFVPTIVGGEAQVVYAGTEIITASREVFERDYPWLLPTLYDYASLDAKASLELYYFFKSLLEKRPAKALGATLPNHWTLWDLYQNWWNPGLFQLTEYERAGVDVDIERCSQSSAALAPDIEAQAAVIRAWSGDVNWRSGPQGPEYLYTRRGFKVPPYCGSKLEAAKKTKRGKRPADFVALTYLADAVSTGPEDKAGLRAVLAWRALVKAKQYTDTFGEYVSSLDGRVHTILAPEADTGRLSSRAPALQQIPKRDKYRVRKAFVAPPGWKLIVADYSQLEMYIAAHFMKIIAHDDKLEQLLASGDMHSAMAIQAWPHELRGLTPAQVKAHPRRDHAKAVGYGLFYGKSAVGLGIGIRGDDGEPIGTEAAQKILDAYHAAVPALAKLQRYFIEYGKEHWGIHTLLGRFRPVADIHSEDEWRRGEAERQLLNTPIQGSAHDVVQTAMLKLNTFLRADLCRYGFFHEPLHQCGAVGNLQVHDELQWRVPAQHAERAAELVKAGMENPFPPGVFSVPLRADVHIADSWGDAK